MSRALIALLAGSLTAGCLVRMPPRVLLGPLEGEGELVVYLQPLPEEERRVAFTLASLLAVGADGVGVPLTVVLPELAFTERAGQRLLAHGRLPPGLYSGLSARFSKATLSRPAGAADLLVPEGATAIDVPFRVEKGRAGLIVASLRRLRSPDNEFALAPSFSAVLLHPAHTLTQLDGYCSNEALANVTVFDKHRHQAVAALSSGREPQGLAVDGPGRRLYVALSGQDQLQIVDLSTGDEVRRVSLQPGDRPRELALTPGGMLVVTNAGSATVAFVDPLSGATIDRVAVGDEPTSVLLDRAGQRAYVFNRRSSTISVLDLATRSIASTVSTDPEPLRGQLNRADTRLFVIHRGSQYLTVFSLPDLAPVQRLYVGPGASALKVDPKTDLLYVGNTDEARIQVFDPFSLIPVDWIDVPGPVSYLTIDDVENALVSVVPSSGAVVFTDLTSKKTLAVVEVGGEPFQVAVEGERR